MPVAFAALELFVSSERAFVATWVVLCLAYGAGWAAIRRGMPTAKLLLALALFGTVLGRLCVDAYATGQNLVRLVLIVPAVGVLSSAFGATAFLLAMADGAPAGRPMWLWERRFGLTLLVSKSNRVISRVVVLSLVGVSLGVSLVLVSMGVLSGFEEDLTQKIMGAHAHVTLAPKDAQLLRIDAEQLAAVQQVSGVSAACAQAVGEAAVASDINFSGIELIGVDFAAGHDVFDLLGRLPDTAWQADADLRPRAIVGKELAHGLGLKENDTLRIISPALSVLSPMGPVPKSMSLRVGGIFSSNMYEVDARLVFVPLATAQKLLGLKIDEASGIAVRLSTKDAAAVDTIVPKLVEAASNTVAHSYKEKNQTLFKALQLERLVAFVVLAFIILVASFSIVNTLSMSIVERRFEIAILKAMGASDSSIMRVFCTQGVTLGLMGTALGTAVGTGVCWLLKTYGLGIPYEVYYIDALPVATTLADVMLVVVAAQVIIWDFVAFPAASAARLLPAEGLRDG